MSTSNATSRDIYWLCPLYSFTCDSQIVDLAEDIQVKPAFSELGVYIQQHAYDIYGRWDDPSEVNWVVLIPYQAKVWRAKGIENIRIGLKENDRARDLLLDFVSALRLCHKGQVTAGPLISAEIQGSQWSIGGSTVWTSVSQRDFLHKEPKYTLRQLDIVEVNKLLKGIRDWRNVIDIALRRFHSAYHGNIEDRIIDQMIAFESLYIADDKELGYKLRLRTAFLLGERKKQIFSDMKKAYDFRGQIMHGNKKVERAKLEAIVPKTEEYLRQSIRRFLLLLSQGKKLEEIRAKLDEHILNNGRLLSIKK